MRLLLLVLAMWCTCLAADARTLRWSSQTDLATADPHGVADTITASIMGTVYESLLFRGKKLELLPGLATGWEIASPTTWRFRLRRGVTFHDGTPFTAADVVFSVQRARGPTSALRAWASTLGEPRALDDHLVEFQLPAPNPLMLENVMAVPIMSRQWAERHGVVRAQDYREREETYASRHASGTGPFILVSREADVRTVFRKNPAWWGLEETGYWEGNLEEVVYFPLREASARMAALLAGNLDFVLDPPLQDIDNLRRDPRIRLLEGPENRVIFLGMDQHRDQLLYSDVKGRNPFKDRRVRLALYHAIDIEALHRSVMRRRSVPAGVILSNIEAAGVPVDLDRRHAHDPAAARRLLAAAGYPRGFRVTLDCSNDRYVNDEKICVAIAAMLGKVGIETKVNAQSRSLFFPRLLKRDSSLFLFGWGGSNTDPLLFLTSLVRSRGPNGDGDFNIGNVSDPEVDALIDAARVEMDAAKRMALMVAALRRHNEHVYHIPLHRQVMPWAMRANVSAVHRASNTLQPTWVTIR